MGNIVDKNNPCKHCSSTDAVMIYEDDSAYCFSCEYDYRPGSYQNDRPEKVKTFSPRSYKMNKQVTNAEIGEFAIRALKDRKISKEVAEFYGVRVGLDEDGQIATHYYPYSDCYKVRELPKQFKWNESQSSKALFGREKFAGAGRRLIIAEGEIDALSIAEASYLRYNKFYPVCGVSSSVMAKSLAEDRAWIRSFKEVVLMFDNDDAGEKATREAAKIIGFDKVKMAKFQRNDANDLLRNDGPEVIMTTVFDAEPYIPSGIITSKDIWTALEEYDKMESIPYPPCMQGVNLKLKGLRGGEITLFISGTGSGKSTLLREIGLELLETGTEKLGVVSLEESPAETARKFSGMAIKRNPALEEIPLEELKVGFDKVFGDDRVMLLDHQGSMNDSSIMDKLEYMCLMGCKYLFIDHITILVSEGVDNLQGLEAQDKVMNDLLRLVKKYPDVWIGLVSHLRKAPSGGTSFEEGQLPTLDDIRGSGSIKQISFDIIAFARNMFAEEEKARNTIKMAVLKARFTGLTGPVAGAEYNPVTGRLFGLTGYSDGEGESFKAVPVVDDTDYVVEI
ncbi:toprim domain-containing protein [bacterium]|nr:toprim domain-containing protein [bacterium]